jgi:hypothetical protein
MLKMNKNRLYAVFMLLGWLAGIIMTGMALSTPT